MTATILVIEDEPAIQQLISYSLKQAGYEVRVAGSAENAMQNIHDSLPDLILLDWMLPGLSGLEFTRNLKTQQRTRALPIILLTARAEEQDKLLGLDVGADDYITKPFSTKELNARIKAVLRRRAPQRTDDIVKIGDLCLDPATHLVTANEKIIELGPTEFRLLHYLMAHSGRVHSRTQLLDKVWGDHVFVEERTVDVHIRRLRKALQDASQDHLIQTVRGTGYRLSV